MIVVDYGGRAPDPTMPHDGAVQAWDTSARTYTDYATGQSRPFTDDETVRFAGQIAADERAAILAALSAGITDLQSALAVASTDITNAQARAGQAQSFATSARTQQAAVTAWTPTVTGATDLATLRARTATDLTTVRAAVADVLDRIATLGDAVQELYAARALHGQGIALAYRDLIGLAGLAAREIQS